MKRIIEIRAAEGGADSQLFVGDLAVAFEKLGLRKGWKVRRVSERTSGAGHHQINLECSGAGCEVLALASGGHRVQRVPPTEKRGRVHTSTATIAVMELGETAKPAVSRSDLQITWFSGTGKGGQHRNKHQNSCRVVHLPTGISETRQSREKDANLREAIEAIEARIADAEAERVHGAKAVKRRQQVGSGMRGDKAVTIRFQDDTVRHHLTGKSMSARRFMRGHMEEIW